MPARLLGTHTPGRRETCRAKLVNHRVDEEFYIKTTSLREQRRNRVGRGARGEERFRVQYMWIIRTEKVEKTDCANWRRSGSGENGPASESSFPVRRELGWNLHEPSGTVGRIIMTETSATTDTGRAGPRDLSVAVVRKSVVDVVVRVLFSGGDEVRTKFITCHSWSVF